MKTNQLIRATTLCLFTLAVLGTHYTLEATKPKSGGTPKPKSKGTQTKSKGTQPKSKETKTKKTTASKAKSFAASAGKKILQEGGADMLSALFGGVGDIVSGKNVGDVLKQRSKQAGEAAFKGAKVAAVKTAGQVAEKKYGAQAGALVTGLGGKLTGVPAAAPAEEEPAPAPAEEAAPTPEAAPEEAAPAPEPAAEEPAPAPAKKPSFVAKATTAAATVATQRSLGAAAKLLEGKSVKEIAEEEIAAGKEAAVSTVQRAVKKVTTPKPAPAEEPTEEPVAEPAAAPTEEGEEAGEEVEGGGEEEASDTESIGGGDEEEEGEEAAPTKPIGIMDTLGGLFGGGEEGGGEEEEATE